MSDLQLSFIDGKNKKLSLIENFDINLTIHHNTVQNEQKIKVRETKKIKKRMGKKERERERIKVN